jgi:hypothetical protein
MVAPHAQRILTEAKATLARLATMPAYVPPEHPVTLDRWQRAAEPVRRKPKLDTEPFVLTPGYVEALVAMKVAEAINEARDFHREVLIGVVAELKDDYGREIARLTAEVKTLRTALETDALVHQRDLLGSLPINGHA